MATVEIKPLRPKKCRKCRGKHRRDAVYGDLCGHHYALEVDKFQKWSRATVKRYVVK
jgi:hypothetical protein